MRDIRAFEATETALLPSVEIWWTDDETKDWGGLHDPSERQFDTCGALVVVAEGVCVEIVGMDGGEPEDQLLVRDWNWVKDLTERLILAHYQLSLIHKALKTDFICVAYMQDIETVEGYGYIGGEEK